MNKYRSLENIIRDVSAGRAQVSEKLSMVGTIRKLGKKPTEAPLAKEPTDNTIAPGAKVVSKDVPQPEVNMLAKVMDVGSLEHEAHKLHAKRSQRKLKIID